MLRQLLDDLKQLPLQEDVALRERTVDLLRRLMNEGIGPFLVSMVFLTVGLICLTLYYSSLDILDKAVTNEILSVLGTPQEPSDTTALGLIAVALAKVNAPRKPPVSANTVDCDVQIQLTNCVAFDRLYSQFADRVGATEDRTPEGTPPLAPLNMYAVGLEGTPPLRKLPDWFRYRPPSENRVHRPEVDNGYECFNGASAGLGVGNEQTFVLIPAQMKENGTNRATQALQQSQALASILASVKFPDESNANQLVQAYFITPDSTLRIWSARGTNVCKEFSPTRLWASKSYFDYFWNHTNEKHLTHAYIDYGGNGLVRTLCRDIAAMPAPVTGGRLFGVLCADFKIRPQEYSAALHRHLLLQTADVSIQLPVTQDSVTVMESQTEQNEADPPTPEEDAAFAMLRLSAQLSPKEITEAVSKCIRDQDPDKLTREITRIVFPDPKGAGFILPLGVIGTPEVVQAVFFYPRNPRLPLWPYRIYAIAGYAALGVFFCSLVYGALFRTQANRLRDRQALLRNLQVGVVQVDEEDWIIECNDRAEELFERKLPKYGTRRLRVNFHELLDVRAERIDEGSRQPHTSGFREITKDKIDELRQQSKASSYYARLKKSNDATSKGTWLLVSATPMMLALHTKKKPDQVMLSNIFATIVAASPETTQSLNNWLDGGKANAAHA